jgi:sulfate/thiosulfate transport system permease protein
MLQAFHRHRVLPGFGLTLGFSVFYLSLIVLIPLGTAFLKTFTMSWDQFWTTVTGARALASYRLSLGASMTAAAINTVMGLVVAWVLVRYEFTGKRILDALVDLPFALPTAVAGITLTAMFAGNGWLGSFFESLGVKVAFTWLGVVVALTFIGLPFVVRTLEPILQDLDPEIEEAAATLGANRWQAWTRVIFPELLPAVLTGFALAFARAIGEYGSVVFISGNMPMQTEITPLLIMTKLAQFDYAGATALAVAMLTLSFGLLFLINLLQWWSRARYA